MSAFTLELLADPELQRIAEQALSEVHARVVAERRKYRRAEVADRIAELLDWRARAQRAEETLNAVGIRPDTNRRRSRRSSRGQ